MLGNQYKPYYTPFSIHEVQCREKADKLAFIYEELINIRCTEELKVSGLSKWMNRCPKTSICGNFQPRKLQWPTVRYKHQLGDLEYTCMPTTGEPSLSTMRSPLIRVGTVLPGRGGFDLMSTHSSTKHMRIKRCRRVGRRVLGDSL
jgi:hypothetical protein